MLARRRRREERAWLNKQRIKEHRKIYGRNEIERLKGDVSATYKTMMDRRSYQNKCQDIQESHAVHC